MPPVNSDDPAYFGGYIGANFAAARATGLSNAQLVQLAKNSFTVSFLPPLEKQRHITALDDVAAKHMLPAHRPG